MRVETKTVTYYTLAELKEHHPNGYERALDLIRTAMWDGGEARESVADDMAYEFGVKVGEPTVERFGEGDYPGVAGVELKGWDLERGSYVAFAGTLEREHSPALPWDETGWLDSVTLTTHSHGTAIDIRETELAPYIGWDTRNLSEDQRRLQDLREEMVDAIRDVLGDVVTAGQEAARHIESEEYLLETADANEWEFDEHGAWA